MSVARKTERGNVTVVALMGMVVMCLFLSMALFVALAYVSWSCMSHALEASKDTVAGTSFQMSMKSSQQPGREIAEKIASSFRASGYQQELTVWFYESSLAQLGDNVRALAFVAQSSYRIDTNLSAEPLDIVCETSSYFVPYSEDRVYKPPASKKVLKYEFAYGSNHAELTQVSLEESPASLTSAIDNAQQLALTY